VKPDGISAGRPAALAWVACALSCATPVYAEEVSFSRDVRPVLMQHCVMCHLPEAAQGGHALYPDAWAQMVNVPSTQSPLLLVAPGDPDASYTYLKLIDRHRSAGGSGEIMPSPNGPLSAEAIEDIRAWIEQGAPNN